MYSASSATHSVSARISPRAASLSNRPSLMESNRSSLQRRLTMALLRPVRTARLIHEGEVVEDLDALIRDTVGEENAFSYDLYRVSDPSQSVLGPEEELTVFSVPWEPRTRLLTERWAGKVSLEICFCSVYDDCWLARLDGGEPETTPSCED